MTLPGRKGFTRFDGSDVESQTLLRALNDFVSDLDDRFAAIEQSRRVVVLDDILFETHGGLAVGLDPFPIRVQTPFSVAGAWVVLCEAEGEAQISTSGVSAWIRPVSGGVDGEGNAVEIQFVTGLSLGRKYRLRLAVVGVKNG